MNTHAQFRQAFHPLNIQITTAIADVGNLNSMDRPLKVSVGVFTINLDVILGHGTFAEVFLGEDAKGNKYAVKRIHKSRLSKASNRKLLESETAILRVLDHPNIVKLIDIVIDGDYTNLVLEYCNGGDLGTYISRNSPMEEFRISYFAASIADGLQYLRARNIIHRDLKPQNILLHSSDESGSLPVLKIADFGFARYLKQDMAATFCGSPLYMAPEVLEGESYNELADLWSVGVIVFQCLTGKTPFRAGSIQALQQLLKSTGGSFYIPDTCSTELRDLLQLLLRVDPHQRCTFEQLFSHPFLNRSRQVLAQSAAIPIHATAPSKLSPNAHAASAAGTPEDAFVDGSYIFLDKEHIALNVALEATQNKVVAPRSIDRRVVADFISLVESLLEPANAVMIAAKDRLCFGASSLTSNSMSASEVASTWSPSTPAEGLLLFGKALTLFHDAAQHIRNEIESKRINLAIPEIRERALLFKNKFDDCVNRVEKLRSEISNDAFFTSVVNRRQMTLAVEELLLEYAKRLCKEGASSETVLNYQTSEMLYARAISIFRLILESNLNEDEQLTVDHLMALAQFRLKRVLALRSKPIDFATSSSATSTTAANLNMPSARRASPSSATTAMMQVATPQVDFIQGDSPPDSDTEDYAISKLVTTTPATVGRNVANIQPNPNTSVGSPLSTLPRMLSFNIGIPRIAPSIPSPPHSFTPPLSSPQVSCVCGAGNSPGSNFCNHCGNVLRPMIRQGPL